MSEWLEPQAVEADDDLREAVGGHPLISQHLTRKGIVTAAAAKKFLSAGYYSPAAANDLPDIDRAVNRLAQAIRQKEQILIWGDFDVDGQSATALLVSALRKRGAQVHYYLPNRFSEGHGIHLKKLKAWLDGGIELVLTCDTGVTAHEAIDYAAARGVDMIVTDHHTVPPELPSAFAMINPRRLPQGHPLIELPGVGVAYKLIEALYQGEDTDFLHDLVALGIVADVMAQVDDTRYLLQRGLKRLRENHRLGLRAILERADIPPAEINEGHIGFALAPRLNALGRLDDANPAVELLTTADWEQARILANNLEGLNARRKFLSNQVYLSAAAQIEKNPSLLEYAALVISHPDWHSGVIGIVASRLVEEYGRPVALIATSNEIGRGSARSLAGLDITAALGQAQQYIIRYGGHSMAAGFSLPSDQIFDFRRSLSQAVRNMGGGREMRPALQVDGYLELSDISLELAQDIERLAPFGNGNPPLALVSRNLKVVRRAKLGRQGEHLQLHIQDQKGNRQQVIWWRGASRVAPGGLFDLAYTLRSSTYQGRPEALLEWLDARQLSPAMPALQRVSESFELIDKRQSDQPQADFADMLVRYPDALVWSEADELALDMAASVNRLNLVESKTLIVWTIPPSSAIWTAGLDAVKPARLILFGMRPDTETRVKLIPRLAALVKYVLNQKAGRVRLADLAAATGHRDATVRRSLQVLRALGTLDYQLRATGEYQLSATSKSRTDKPDKLQGQLDLLLRETRAWRNYWLTMPMPQLGEGDNKWDLNSR